jgi:hypothetical protein
MLSDEQKTVFKAAAEAKVKNAKDHLTKGGTSYSRGRGHLRGRGGRHPFHV